MRRQVLIAGGVIALILLVAGIFFLVRKQDGSVVNITPPPPPQENPVVPPPVQIPDATTLVIGTPEGSVSMKNFYKNAVEVRDFATLVARTDAYDLVYFSEGGTFLITISSKPVGESVRAAESDFLKLLGISKDDACKLKTSLSVPRFTDPDLAGNEYGLSFCIGRASPLTSGNR